MKKFINWLFYHDCPKCKERQVYFSHEEYFTAGSPNVYICKSCNTWYV